MLKIFKRIEDDSNEFKPLLIEIEDAPQNPLGRSILWIACAALIFAVLWMVFAKVDIVVSANGKVVPDGEIKILKSLESGVVSKILVKEGDRVKKGDRLILIDPSVSTVNLSTKQESLALLEYSIKRLDALSSGRSLDANISADELSLYNTQKSNYEESINVYNLKMQALQMGINSTNLEVERLSGILKIDEARLNNLNKVKDIIARKDLYELKSKVIELSSNLKISKEKLAEQRANLDELAKELEAFKSQSISKWLDEMLAKQKEASSLKAEINAILFQTRQQIISSPVDGFVGKLLVNTQGTAITNQENLISIVPSDKPLIIKANVLNKDIGYLENNQSVAIKVQTFDFQKYGKLEGELIHIANDAINDEKLGEIYEVKIRPDSTFLIVDGIKKEIEPGMSVTAEVKVGKRRVIELFIYPVIKYLDEGLSVR